MHPVISVTVPTSLSCLYTQDLLLCRFGGGQYYGSVQHSVCVCVRTRMCVCMDEVICTLYIRYGISDNDVCVRQLWSGL